MRPPIAFTDQHAQEAYDAWGMNCGPGAIAAVLGMTPTDLRPFLGDFEQKGYTNPTMMRGILQRLGVVFEEHRIADPDAAQFRVSPPWPHFGLARVQWEGPWTRPGVPPQARYGYTHWVGVDGNVIFDINAISVGGWITVQLWRDQLVPWLLKEFYPKADGNWHVTHAIEIVKGLP